MEGNSRRENRVLAVQRDYECSRVEQAQLAAAYERVLPAAEVVLAESSSRPDLFAATPVVFASEADGTETNLCATGGHLS